MSSMCSKVEECILGSKKKRDLNGEGSRELQISLKLRSFF